MRDLSFDLILPSFYVNNFFCNEILLFFSRHQLGMFALSRTLALLRNNDMLLQMKSNIAFQGFRIQINCENRTSM